MLNNFLINEQKIQFIKADFEKNLVKHLNVTKVSSPLIVADDTGINDDLNGIEKPISFNIKFITEKRAAVVQSLAKWKRIRLKYYGIEENKGILTDMRAIRPDEKLSPIHSIYVDQWDWEKNISYKQRNISYLKYTVICIYNCIKQTEQKLFKKYSEFVPELPDDVTFIHSEELLRRYPNLTPFERENEICKLHKAVFIIGIGNTLSNGIPHDKRAPDYDDWISPNDEGYYGLNGDIIFWNSVTNSSFEISSMGIRVDKHSMLKQLELSNNLERRELFYHNLILNGELPYSIGGGIGQSRLCMFLLKKSHIGEVQSSIWSQETEEYCKQKNIYLL